MLVLSRKVGEHIRIGENITLTVVELQGGRVRLGIAAPAEVPVLRSELLAVRSDTPAPDSTVARLEAGTSLTR